MHEPWSNPRSANFWFRKKVPVRLRAVVGRTEIRKSLGTDDPILAKPRNETLHAEWDARFERLAAEHTALDHYAVDALAGKFYEAMVERHMREPGTARRWQNRARTERLLFSIMPKRYLARPLTTFPNRPLQIEVAQFLIDRGLNLDPETHHRVLVAIGRVTARAADRLAALANHDYTGGTTPPEDLNLGTFPVEDPKRTPANKFDRLFERFTDEAGYPEKTRNSSKARVAKFMAFSRLDYPADVTSAHAVAYKDHLLASKLDPVASIRNGHLAAMRAFMNWCVANDFGPDEDPFARIKVYRNRDEAKKLKTKGYTDEEAALILRSALLPMEDEGSVDAAARRWIPWICATTGARVSEVAQLRKVDVAMSGRTRRFAALPILRFVLAAGPQKVAERVVPLHPDLIALGFLDFVANAPGERLFVDPSRVRTRRDVVGLVAKAGQRVAAWARTMLAPDREVQPNHAWRHRFNDLADEALLPPEMRDAITGHAPATEGAKYGSKKAGVMLHWMGLMDSHLELVVEFHPETVAGFPPAALEFMSAPAGAVGVPVAAPRLPPRHPRLRAVDGVRQADIGGAGA